MSTSVVNVVIGVMFWWAVDAFPAFPCAGVTGKVGTLSDLLSIPEAGVTKVVLLVTRYIGPSYSGWCVLVIITVLYGEKSQILIK